SGEWPRPLPPPHPPQPSQPVRPRRVLVAADRPGRLLRAPVRPRPEGARDLAADSRGVQGQGARRGRRQGSADAGSLPAVPLAGEPLFRQVVRVVVLTGSILLFFSQISFDTGRPNLFNHPRSKAHFGSAHIRPPQEGLYSRNSSGDFASRDQILLLDRRR